MDRDTWKWLTDQRDYARGLQYLAHRGVTDPAVIEGRPWLFYPAGMTKEQARAVLRAVDPKTDEMKPHERGTMVRQMRETAGLLLPRHPADPSEKAFVQLRPLGELEQRKPHAHTEMETDVHDGKTRHLTRGGFRYTIRDTDTSDSVERHVEDGHAEDGVAHEHAVNWTPHLQKPEYKADHARAWADGRLDARDEHLHTRPQRFSYPPGEGRASIVGIHPLARVTFERGGRRLYIIMEGTAKADAVLTWLRAHGRDHEDTVIDIGSITLHRQADAFDGILDLVAKFSEVVIVTDADYARGSVDEEKRARAARDVAREAKKVARRIATVVPDVVIAAPPVALGLKGVDDFLAAGHGLDELETSREQVAEHLAWWAGRRVVRLLKSHADDVAVMEYVAAVADDEGVAEVGIRTIARDALGGAPLPSKNVGRMTAAREALSRLQAEIGIEVVVWDGTDPFERPHRPFLRLTVADEPFLRCGTAHGVLGP